MPIRSGRSLTHTGSAGSLQDAWLPFFVFVVEVLFNTPLFYPLIKFI